MKIKELQLYDLLKLAMSYGYGVEHSGDVEMQEHVAAQEIIKNFKKSRS